MIHEPRTRSRFDLVWSICTIIAFAWFWLDVWLNP